MMNSPHERHVRDGYCDNVNANKTWCNLPYGHLDSHGAVRIPHPDRPVDEQNPDWVEWD